MPWWQIQHSSYLTMAESFRTIKVLNRTNAKRIINYRVYAPSNGRNFLNRSDTFWQYRYVSDTLELVLRHFTFTLEEADYLWATTKRDNHDWHLPQVSLSHI